MVFLDTLPNSIKLIQMRPIHPIETSMDLALLGHADVQRL